MSHSLFDITLADREFASPEDRSEVRILFGYCAPNARAEKLYHGILARACAAGFDVTGVNLALDGLSGWCPSGQLFQLHNQRDSRLCCLREKLLKKSQDRDVFWNFSGGNVHPEWLQDLSCLSVFGCFDDPESSYVLSWPVAKYYHASLVGNVACLPLYRSWGIREVKWVPLAFVGHELDPGLTPENILEREYEHGIVFFGERKTQWRADRLETLAKAFPQAEFFGRGWPNGFVDDEERLRIYRTAKIGWNLHNSVGPVNMRFFSLPANGVMQICDNRFRAGKLFRLGSEIEGFGTVDECIDLTRYYLSHDDERRHVAANGFRRHLSSYREELIWNYVADVFCDWHERKETLTREEYAFRRRPFSNALRANGKRFISVTLKKVGLHVQRIGTSPKSEVVVKAPFLRCQCAESNAMAIPYRENEPVGASNLKVKQAREAEGGYFEWPDIAALNSAVASLVSDEKRILELGSGTGLFAYEVSCDPRIHVTASELDTEACEWAKQNRSRENIHYISRMPCPDDGPFDLVVAVEVIEHVRDYKGFLETCKTFAPRVIITTPNRLRPASSVCPGPPAYWTHRQSCTRAEVPMERLGGPPSFVQHVREWSAGEFYWICRTFFRDVRLFAMADPHVPALVPVSLDATETPLLAVCED